MMADRWNGSGLVPLTPDPAQKRKPCRDGEAVMDPGENKPIPADIDRDLGSNNGLIVVILVLAAIAGIVVTLVSGLIGALSGAHFA